MTVSPATTIPTTSDDVVRRYLEDLFMQARDRSRKLHKIHGRVEQLAKQQQETGVSEHEIAVSEFLAAIAPMAVAAAENLARGTVIYSQAIFDLNGEDVDTLIRPMFNMAGLADDFLDASERDRLSDN